MNLLKLFSKNGIALLLFALVSLTVSTDALSQTATLQQKSNIFPFSYSNNDFSYCEPTTRDFIARYDFCPATTGMCGPNSCGSNPYKIEAQLFRDNTLLSTQERQLGTAELNFFFNGVTVAEGDYRVVFRFRRRRVSCFGWILEDTRTSNIITSTKLDATPGFNVNGTTVPTDGSPITVCASNIKINAASTSCESSYYIAVEECNRWWSRTYDYEWSKWVSGKAPNNLNLQQLSTTYSYGSNFTGSSSRQGSTLIGGNLPNGSARYYRVKVCTNDPWSCKTALIRVDGSCKKGADNLVILESEEQTTSFDLDIYPNPAYDQLTVQYSVEKEGALSIDLYDLTGKKIKNLLNTTNEIGAHKMEFDVSNINQGTYLVIMKSSGHVKTAKLAIGY
jgi:hypothetical protein